MTSTRETPPPPGKLASRALCAGLGVALGSYITSLGSESRLTTQLFILVALSSGASIGVVQFFLGTKPRFAHSLSFGLGFFVFGLTDLLHGTPRIGLSSALLESAIFACIMGAGGYWWVFRSKATA